MIIFFAMPLLTITGIMFTGQVPTLVNILGCLKFCLMNKKNKTPLLKLFGCIASRFSTTKI
jgi:hypothetical protein